MIIETDRIETKYLSSNDLQDLIDLQQDYSVMRYITGKPMETEMIVEELKRDMEQYESDNPWITVMGIVEKSTRAFLGTVALYFSEEKHWEIGYRILPRYWGQGYATEAVLGLLDYVKTKGKPNVVYGAAVRENTASIKVMEHVGMQFTREYYIDAENVFVKEYMYRFQ